MKPFKHFLPKTVHLEEKNLRDFIKGLLGPSVETPTESSSEQTEEKPKPKPVKRPGRDESGRSSSSSGTYGRYGRYEVASDLENPEFFRDLPKRPGGSDY